MNDRVSNSSAMTESSAVEIEIATRRLMAALDSSSSTPDPARRWAQTARGLPTSSTARW